MPCRCGFCGHSRPHEHFGGRGEHAVICGKCCQRPREERKRALLEEEVLCFLDQSNISSKNLRRLEKIEADAPADLAALAALVRQIALVRPRNRRRWKLLRQQHQDLFRRASQAGLLDDLEPSQLGARNLDECTGEGGLDGWIEPWPCEIEPTTEEFRSVSGGFNLAELRPPSADWLYTAAKSHSAADQINLLDASLCLPASAVKSSAVDRLH